jgi:hypothetical protein
MKMWAIVPMLAVIGAVVQAKDSSSAQPSSVNVYIQFRFGGTKLMPMYAKRVASEILAKAGVRILWRTGLAEVEEDEQPILVEVTSSTPEELFPGAMGYAHDGIHIRIFGDRVHNAGGVDLENTLLAHVLVHEITHILEGIPHHSQDGVMKAHWTPQDLVRMASRSLPFDPQDVALIHSGLARYCFAGQERRTEACSLPQSGSTNEQPAAIPAN